MTQNRESRRLRGPISAGRPGWIDLDGIRDRIDLAAVAGVTLVSASARLDRPVENLLLISPSWFTATDHDEAGQRTGARWPASARRVNPPEPYKHWTEAHLGGVKLLPFLQSMLGTS